VECGCPGAEVAAQIPTSSPPPRERSVPDAHASPSHAFGWVGKRFGKAKRDPMCTPGGRGGIEHVVKRSACCVLKRVDLNPVPAEKSDPFKRAARRLLSIAERAAIVHRPKGDFGVNLAHPVVVLCELGHVEDARSERVRLGGDA
jgi:hypothetical protein